MLNFKLNDIFTINKNARKNFLRGFEYVYCLKQFDKHIMILFLKKFYDLTSLLYIKLMQN